MKQHRVLPIVVLVVVALNVIGLLKSGNAIAQNPHPGSAPVNIVAPLPLPISGNVNINANTAATPVWITSADNPARHVFQFQATGTGTENSLTLGLLNAVPTGERFVIEHYSVRCRITQGTTPREASVVTFDPTHPTLVEFDSSAVLRFVSGGAGGDNWSASGNTRIYANPGWSISINVISSGSIQSCVATVSGYSVSLP